MVVFSTLITSNSGIFLISILYRSDISQPTIFSCLIGGKTSSKLYPFHSSAGNTIDPVLAFADLAAAQRAARATGEPNTEQLYLNGVPTYPTVTIPLAIPI